jgi:N-methylhydantoinase A
MAQAKILAGVDTGGTFTDFIFIFKGRIHVDKRPSRPADPVSVIREGIAAFLRNPDGREDPGQTGEEDDRAILERNGKKLTVIHGTTVPTNALLEGKTAKTCLITNRGFEDVVEIGRQERLNLFHLPARKARAPVPRRLRFGVNQRTLHTGREETRLTTAEIAAVAARAAKSGARAAAVCLLYSFLDGRPEERLGHALRKAGLTVSLSSRVAPEFREYERTTTTVINASLKPVMEDYLARLETAFPGAGIFVMCSSGGVAPPAETADRPVATILSGPAGGVAGTDALLRCEKRTPKKSEHAAGLPARKAITFDMGGTSTDVALIDGEPLRRHQSSILGLPLLAPAIDIHTVGAGGGSKIWIDRGGALRVGPESTGADPGPACYGRALIPALTDAHIVLGRLDGAGLLDGRFPVDARRSARALSPLARRLKVPPEKLCRAVLDVADAVVEKAIRVITLGRGRDPRDFPLVAFGGAGGLHACRLMLGMGLPAVIVPPNPGVLSAAGIAVAELREERARGCPLPLTPGSAKKLNGAFDLLEENWREEREFTGRTAVTKEIDLRYSGQSFQLTIPFAGGRTLAKRFHEKHHEQYGHSDPNGSVEAVTIRARFRRSRGSKASLLFGADGESTASNNRNNRQKQASHGRPKPHARLAPIDGFGSGTLPLFARGELEPGDVVAGPAVVREFTATTVVEKGCILEVDAAGCLIIKREKKQRAP